MVAAGHLLAINQLPTEQVNGFETGEVHEARDLTATLTYRLVVELDKGGLKSVGFGVVEGKS